MRNVSRVEKKFLMNVADASCIQARLAQVMHGDEHNGTFGYPVRSLYFDTPHDRDYHEKVDGIELRRKVRLRVYDPASDVCLLELKQKEGPNQLKRSLSLPRRDGLRLVAGEYDLLLGYGDPFAAEMHAILCGWGYLPCTIVEYDRTAFVAQENRIRITFDRNIRATEVSYDVFSSNLPLYPVMDPFNLVLEVKFNGFLLSYVREVLNLANRSETSVSKYTLARSATLGHDY